MRLSAMPGLARRARRRSCGDLLVRLARGRTSPARSGSPRAACRAPSRPASRRENSSIDSRAQLAELVVGHLARASPDQVEALGQRALVREVVERRQQLALRQVARRPEDHERGRVDRVPLEPLDAAGSPRCVASAPSSLFTAWPPNWLRSAALTLAAKRLVLPRREAREQRRGDHRRRHAPCRSRRRPSSGPRRSPAT